MGLFGLFYTTFVLGAKGVLGIKNSLEDNDYKKEAVSHGEDIYINSKGISCHVKNDKPTIYTHIYKKDGSKPDYVLKYAGTDKIIRNFSKEERDGREKYYYEKALELGRTAYRLGGDRDNYRNVDFRTSRGYRYKDIETKEIYVVREVDEVLYYMSVKTGLLVRKTDGQLIIEERIKEKNPIKYNKFLEHDRNNFIKKYNKMQLKYHEEDGYISYDNSKAPLSLGDLYQD